MQPAKGIPGTVTKVDMTTGKETHEGMTWGVLPPKDGACKICARSHPAEHPHDRESLYYQMMFNGQLGRAPTWADAMAHCDAKLQGLWRRELEKLGHWSEPPAGEAPVKHHGIE